MYLRVAMRVRARASEASTSSALNESSSSPRARLVRLHTCKMHACLCMYVRACVATCSNADPRRANQRIRWWRTVNAERRLFRRYFVIVRITFYWRDLHSITPTSIFHSTFPPELSSASISKVKCRRQEYTISLTTENQTTREKYAGNLFARLG